MRNILKACLTYFLLVFSAGFILGIPRVLLLVPKFGERYAELIEIPVMLVVIYFAARFIVKKFGQVINTTEFLYSGIMAFILLLIIEFTIVLGLQGISVHEYFITRDPVSGTAYFASLIIFMVMPYYLSNKKSF